MKLVVISPEDDDPRETRVLRGLFAAGLERYHVRKPDWSREKLETWLRALPGAWRPRLYLHQHHTLARELGAGGVHFRDAGSAVVPPSTWQRHPAAEAGRIGRKPVPLFSRSCHDLSTLRAALSRYDSVFFSPVFPSISKPGHAPRPDFSFAELAALLASRSTTERRTTVFALGGITHETAPRALALGFDGVAVLGAVWQAPDPLRAFAGIQSSLTCHAA